MREYNTQPIRSQNSPTPNLRAARRTIMRWTVEVHTVVYFVTNLFMELKYFIKTLVPIPAYQTTLCHMKMDKRVCKMWCHKVTTGRSYHGEFRYRPAAIPAGTFTLPLPNTTTVGINLQVLQNSQNCITGCVCVWGGVPPPIQQARSVPLLQTASPYPVNRWSTAKYVS